MADFFDDNYPEDYPSEYENGARICDSSKFVANRPFSFFFQIKLKFLFMKNNFCFRLQKMTTELSI